jgi:hypothetical protein
VRGQELVKFESNKLGKTIQKVKYIRIFRDCQNGMLAKCPSTFLAKLGDRIITSLVG